MGATITEYVTHYEWPELVDGVQEADEPIRTEADERDYDVTPDEYDVAEGLTVVDLATRLLRNGGVFEASSSGWHSGVWYLAQYVHPYTGVIEETTYHPQGLTDDESRELFRRIVG